MSAPRVGIPLCLDAEGRFRTGRRYHYIDEAYAVAVREAGAVPSYLPIHDDPEAALQGLDGLLLPGGDDFLPETPYPADVHFDAVSEEGWAFDRGLLQAAEARSLPILGICYGMQLIGLSRGARLHHHLPHDRPDAAEHRLGDGGGRHDVRIEPGSRLAEIGGPSLRVNSLHHQAIADAGASLRVTAVAQDGVIEAIECDKSRFLVGVQWHPEKLSTEERVPLFRAFVEACRK